MISYCQMLNPTKWINYQQSNLHFYPHVFVSLFLVELKKNTTALNVCVSLSVFLFALAVSKCKRHFGGQVFFMFRHLKGL